MDEPKNSNGACGGAKRNTDVRSRATARFVASQPPAWSKDRTLAARIRAFANCQHPVECHSSALMTESGGSPAGLSWCGACGAVRTDDDEDGKEWIRPGSAERLRHEGYVAVLVHDMGLLADGLAEVAATAHSLGSRASDPELASGVQDIEILCADLERSARGLLIGIGR